MFLTETYLTETRAHVRPHISIRSSIKKLAHSLHGLISNIKKGFKNKHQVPFIIRKESNKRKTLHPDNELYEFIPNKNLSGTTICDVKNLYYNFSDMTSFETLVQSDTTIDTHDDDSYEEVVDIEFEDPYTTYDLLDEPVFFDDDTTKVTKRGAGSNTFCPARNFNFQFERI
jgi:hypothetical protein